MDMNNATSETSGSRSDSYLPLKKRMRLNEPDTVLVVANATKKVAVSDNQNPKYKGVVQQQNGHWGAQLYADHKRIWLGTFKSAAEAAMAYDSAAIKLRGFDANSHRNFPWSDITVHEPNFQEGHTTEAVLNMIRDGSYQQNFRDFLRVRSQIAFISEEQTEREECEIGGPVENMEVAFYDEAMRQWKFRYCYWRRSQSFVFTRGWNGFVKENNLKEKDVIAFYSCEVPSNVKTLEGAKQELLDDRCSLLFRKRF